MRRLFRHRVRSRATRYHIWKVRFVKTLFRSAYLPFMEMGSTRSYSVTKQSPHFDHLGSCEWVGVNGFEVARVARRRLRNGFLFRVHRFRTPKHRVYDAWRDKCATVATRGQIYERFTHF